MCAISTLDSWAMHRAALYARELNYEPITAASVYCLNIYLSFCSKCTVYIDFQL